jgi:hypothetical protein
MSTLNAANSRNIVKPHLNSFGQIARKSAIALGRILIVLVTILLCLPVILLPLTTPVPAWVWVLLAIADVALIILQFRFALHDCLQLAKAHSRITNILKIALNNN